MEHILLKGRWLPKIIRHGVVGHVKYFGLYAETDKETMERFSVCGGKL